MEGLVEEYKAALFRLLLDFVVVTLSLSRVPCGESRDEFVTETSVESPVVELSSAKYGVLRVVCGKTGMNCPLLLTVCV